MRGEGRRWRKREAGASAGDVNLADVAVAVRAPPDTANAGFARISREAETCVHHDVALDLLKR